VLQAPCRARPGALDEETCEMFDLICIAMAVLFFGVAALFVRGCHALEKEED
jgi:hypothetical protein